jgi:hypothetical protein
VKRGGNPVVVPVAVKEVPMQLPRVSVKVPTGLSFEVPDLVMLKGWSEYHELRMAIELDVCADGDEYEELLGLYEQTSAFRRWMIWRSCDGIVVQPTMGRTMLFDCMADALEILIPARD